MRFTFVVKPPGFFTLAICLHRLTTASAVRCDQTVRAGVAALQRLFNELGERYKDRPGGYTRILRLGHRAGDNAELAIIELVDNPREVEARESEKKRAKAVAGKKKKGEKKASSGSEEAAEAGESEGSES